MTTSCVNCVDSAPKIDHRLISSADSRKQTRPSFWNRLFEPEAKANLAAPIPVRERTAIKRAYPGNEMLVTTAGNHELRVGDVMSTDVISVAPDTPVREIAVTLAQHRISSVPVVDQAGRLVGIVSEGDLIRRAELGTQPRHSWWRSFFADAIISARAYVRSHGRSARDVMTVAPITAGPDEPLYKVAARMARKRLARLPVMRDGRLIGAIARSDLVRKLAGHSVPTARVGDEALRKEVMARMRTLPWKLQVRFVNAEVQDGVATVYGWTASPTQMRALEVAAESTPGIVEARYCIRPALAEV